MCVCIMIFSNLLYFFFYIIIMLFENNDFDFFIQVHIYSRSDKSDIGILLASHSEHGVCVCEGAGIWSAAKKRTLLPSQAHRRTSIVEFSVFAPVSFLRKYYCSSNILFYYKTTLND